MMLRIKGPIRNYGSYERVDVANTHISCGLFKAVTFASQTQAIGTVPANSVIKRVIVIRSTAWDTINAFEVGKSGSTDWLATTEEANVDGEIPAGEDGAAEVVAMNKVVTSDTEIILTLDQGAAAAGAGWVLLEYQELERRFT